jgi:two-component system, cell cycle response regulator CpdR
MAKTFHIFTDRLPKLSQIRATYRGSGLQGHRRKPLDQSLRLKALLSCCDDIAAKDRVPMTANPSRQPVRRILLAEDDDSMRGFLERALKKAGYEVVCFDNGKDALDRLAQEPFTLLLTDIVMPLMDGIELARRAGELDPRLKIMFITGFAAVTLNTDQQAPKDARVLSIDRLLDA